MPPVRVRVISWATLLFLSREATQYSVAIRALSWALLALVSAILPRSSKYVLVIMVVATFSTPPSVVVSSNSKHLPTMHPEQLNIRGQLRRIPLPRTPVNKAPIHAPDPLGWHHGCCRPVGEKRGLARREFCVGRREHGIGPPLL